jgi:hypothetical protein
MIQMAAMAAAILDPNWKLPDSVLLANADGTLLGTVFADINGDGRPDLITDNRSTNGKPQVWLNQLTLDGGGWLYVDSLSGDAIYNALNSSSMANCQRVNLQVDQMTDVDGDGSVELAYYHRNARSDVDSWVSTTGVRLLRVANNPDNDGLLWKLDLNYSLPPTGELTLKLVDLNRDGLPDLVGSDHNFLSTGNPSRGDNGTVWKQTTLKDDTPTDSTRMADVDGDGLYDRITQAPGGYGSVFLSTGLNWTANGANSYNSLLQLNTLPKPVPGQAVPYGECGDFAPGQFQLVDLNVDGLVDVVVNHLFAARPLINRGVYWSDPNFSSWTDSDANDGVGPNAVPIAASAGLADCHAMYTGAKPGIDAFVDLDGDGLPDHITTVPLLVGSVRRRAWLNRFDPPVIYQFPNGLAAKTLVYYTPISTRGGQSGGSAAIYTDTGTLVDSMGAKTRPLKAPLRVVYSVVTDNGVGLTSNELPILRFARQPFWLRSARLCKNCYHRTGDGNGDHDDVRPILSVHRKTDKG